MNVFQLFGEIALDAKPANEALGDITKNAGKASKKIGKSIGEIQKAFAKIERTTERYAKTLAKGFTVGATAVATAGAAIAKSALGIRSSIEQGFGGAEAIFGQFAWRVKADAAEAWDKAGLSAEEYYATINKMGALFKGSGFSQMEALEKASNAMQRAADVASIMGIDVDMAMESIAGAAKGNFTMMDNLGVAMNDTTLEAYRLEKGLDKAVGTMTTAEKVGLAMDMFMERTAYAAGNYAKENNTVAGSLQTLKGAWSNFLGGVGKLEDVEKSAFSYIRNAAKTLGVDGLEPLINGAEETVAKVADILSMEGLDGRQKYARIRRYLLEKSIGLTNSFGEKLVSGISSASDIMAETLADINVNLPHYIQVGREIFGAIRDGVKKNAEQLAATGELIAPSVISGWFTAKTDFLVIGLDILGGIARGITDDLSKGEDSQIAESLKDGLQKVINSTAKTLPALTDAGLSLISAIIDGVNESDLTGLSTAIEESVTKIVEWVAEPENIKALISAGMKIGKALLSGILESLGRLPAVLLSKITPNGEELLAEYDKKQAEMKAFMQEYNNVFPAKSVKEIVNTPPDTYKNGLKFLTQALLSGGDSSGNTEEKNGAFSAAADNVEKLNLMLASGEITLEEYKAKVEALKTAWDGVPEKKTTTYTVDTEYGGGSWKFGVSPIHQNAAGAIFSAPTIFDTRLGRQMVGEGGPEAVAPIAVLQKYVRAAVQSANRERDSVMADLSGAIQEMREGFNANMNLYINKKHVASALSRDMGRSIGNREYALMRGMGG